MATPLPSNFLESSFRTKVEYEASLQLPDDERAAAETAAAAKHGTAADLFNAMSLEQQRLVAPPPPPPPFPTYYPDGTKVLITELKSRPELNGTAGTIIGFNVEKARYEVRLPSGEALRLKPANVQPPAHFKVLETARLMKADGTGRLPVTVLSGFLGSGKTTLLHHLLHNKDGCRIALIVNDMASVNVDAELVRRGGVLQADEKMVELSNGCICCTLREDLLTAINNLVAERRFDHVLVESSGISEPLPVAETFTFKDETTGVRLSDIASLQNMVTVVDAASIFEQLSTLDMLADRGWQADQGDRRTVPQLLCDQLEFADVLVINKVDLVSEAQLGSVETFVKLVNPQAEVLRTTHSKLEPALLFGKARFSMQRAEEHPQWLQEAREHEHTPETIEYGISSFVFRARLPFHPERLHAALGGSPRAVGGPWAGALGKLLRVKGIAWLAPWSSRQGVVALAGTQLTVTPGQAWWASVKREHWPKQLSEGIENEWQEPHGDKRIELVCIGQDLDHAAAQAELEACLLTEAEMAAGPKSWFGLKDPFYEAWDEEQRLAKGGDHYEEQLAASVTHVLILHKNETVELGAAVGVMEMAGISAATALRLLNVVKDKGKAIVCQGKAEDMKMMAGLFGEVGMKTTVAAGSAPYK